MLIIVDSEDVSPELAQQLRDNASRPLPSPLKLLYSYHPVSIHHSTFSPRYERTLLSGASSTSTSFGTRTPTEKSHELFVRLQRQSDQQGVHFMLEDAIIHRLLNRLRRHVSDSPTDTSRTLYDRWKMAQYVRDFDKNQISAYDEIAVTAAHLIHDGARVNDFLHEKSNFLRGTGPGGDDVSDLLRDVEFRLAPRAGSGTSDGALCANNVMLSAEEEKPKLHQERQGVISQAAGTGYLYGATRPGFYIRSQEMKWSCGTSRLSQTEIHILIQAVEQFFANNTRWLVLRGHTAFTIMYLKSTTDVLVSLPFPIITSDSAEFNIVAALVALALPDDEADEPILVTSDVTLLQHESGDYQSLRSPNPTTTTSSPRATGPSSSADTRPTAAVPPNRSWSSSLFGRNRGVTRLERIRVSPTWSAECLCASPRPDTHIPVPDILRRLTDCDGFDTITVPTDVILQDDNSENKEKESLAEHKFITPPSEKDSPPRLTSLRTKRPRPLNLKHTAPETRSDAPMTPVSPSQPLRLIIETEVNPGRNCTVFKALTEASVRVIVKVSADSTPMLHELEIYNEMSNMGMDAEFAPVVLGVYRERQPDRLNGELYVMVMEDAGDGLDAEYTSWRQFTGLERDEVASLYNVLHSNGLCHGDPELRHLRRRTGDRKIRLIDFDRATLDAGDVEREREEVHGLLGLP